MPPLPLVSILMTCYNRELFIAESIESVLASGYINWELIIVDDASTDGTLAIAAGYAKRDSRIFIYRNEKNLGDYPNRNKAALYAKGKYIKYLDSDDVLYPWGLAVMVACMEANPSGAYGLIAYGLDRLQRLPRLLSPSQAYYEFYFKGSMVITGPTGAIINREVFLAENGFSGKPYLGDTEMWLQLSGKYSLVAMPLDLIWWRRHEGQQYQEGLASCYYLQHSYRTYLQALLKEDCPLPPLHRRRAFRVLKNRYCRNILQAVLKLQMEKAFRLKRMYALTLMDIAKALLPNRYPEPL